MRDNTDVYSFFLISSFHNVLFFLQNSGVGVVAESTSYVTRDSDRNESVDETSAVNGISRQESSVISERRPSLNATFDLAHRCTNDDREVFES